jgi:hypothetical protein
MIRLSLREGCIVVELGDVALAPRHESQLVHWGFRFDHSFNWFDLGTERPEDVAQKVTDYFQKHAVSYEVSTDVDRLLTSHRAAMSVLADAMRNGGSLKSGHPNKAMSRDLAMFLRDNVKRQLKDHQFKAALHLLGVQNGANFSVPGSGKTTVVLVVFHRLRCLGEVDSLLVVGPPSCFWPWRAEYEQVLGTKPRCEILAGGDVDERHSKYHVTRETACDLYLTTFQTLQRDCGRVQQMLRHQGVRFYMVIDEAHYVKQIDGAWANAVLNVAPHVARRCILTGTPFPKSYVDAFNLFDFLWPQRSPLPEHTKHQIQLLMEQKRYTDVANELDSAIGSLFYRVRKDDLGLAAQHCHIVPVAMNKYEKFLYDSVLDRIKDLSRSDYFRNVDLVLRLRRGRMMRLRQCVSYIRLLRTAVSEYAEDILPDDPSLTDVIKHYDKLEKPGKIEALVGLVEDLRNQGQKVVIWSNFIEALRLIRATMRKCGHRAHLIYGATPTEKGSIGQELTREKMIGEFVDRDSGIDILVANPAACAESISLHKTCSNAIYYDLSYNSAQYIQSMDRIHRVGGSEHTPAHYYFLQYNDSIDRDILSNVRSKADNMAALIDRDYPIYSLDMFAEDEELEAYERLFGK